MNLFGADVSGLDAASFLGAARRLYPLAALAWILALVAVPRLRRGAWLLGGVLAANAWVWLETSWPLQRLYALGPSSDRINNVAMSQATAAGLSPLLSPQVGHVHFEPFWAVLMAVLSGFDPARLLEVYAFLPVLTACGFALSLYFALAPQPAADAADADAPWSAWERALVAGAATLLSSAPLDYAMTYRVPWAMTFLLKPNHAAGLVLLPWVLRVFAGIRGARSRVAAGVLLHLLGWVFVVHMAAACAGLVALALMAFALRREDARRDARDAAVVIGLNLLVVSPYLVMLVAGHGALAPNPRHQIPPWSAHFLEATARLGFLLPLAAWGAVVAWGRGRLGRVWAAQAAGALLLWLAFYPLSALDLAKERDDVFYLVRILAAAMAAIGAWDLARRGASALAEPARGLFARPERAAAALAILALPWTVPYWWDPARMDLYFAGSVPPLPASLTVPAAALAHARGAVVVGEPGAARWMTALSGCRVVIARDFPASPDWPFRIELGERLIRGDRSALPDAARFGATHLVVTSADLDALGVSLEELGTRAYLVPVATGRDPDGSFVALFALRAA